MQIIYICFVSIWKHTQISTICAGFKFQWTKTKIIYPWHSKEEDLGLDNSSNNVCDQSKIQHNQMLIHIVNDYITESTTITWYAMLSNMKKDWSHHPTHTHTR